MRAGSFVSRILDLLRLRCGPQDLPYSPTLLVRLVALAFLVDYIAAQLLASGGESPLRFLVGFGLGLLLPWLLLSWTGKSARYAQTLLALLATGIALSLLFLPLALLALSSGMADPGATPSARQALLAWLILALVVWKVLVSAGIWRHALGWPMPAGVAVALLLLLLEFGFDRLLFGGAST